MHPGDSNMARRAACAVLDMEGLCTCSVQVFRLARLCSQKVDVLPECNCNVCNGMMLYRFQTVFNLYPSMFADFHRPGASAMHGPGEKRDETLTGPFC